MKIKYCVNMSFYCTKPEWAIVGVAMSNAVIEPSLSETSLVCYVNVIQLMQIHLC